jgi:cell division protein FtsA
MGLFSFLGRQKRKRDHAIALDIGTEFVKALIFRVEGDRAHVIGVGRQRQRLSDMQGGTVTDIGGVIKNCEAALGRAAEQAGLLPELVMIGIAGELVKGTTTTIQYERAERGTQITLEELTSIMGEVQARSFERARALLAYESGHDEIDVRLVNSAIVDVRIDGYKVTNPLGFQGKEIQVGIFNAFAPIVHFGALQTISAELGLELLSVAAEPYAVARVTGPEESLEFSAIFIDIGGGTTDVAVVNQGGVVGTKMFALGGRAFTKRIAAELGVSFGVAEEQKLAYATGQLSAKETSRVAGVLAADAAVWRQGIELTLEEFTNVDLLPSRILLCGGGSGLPDIVRELTEGDWSSSLPFARRPRVQILKPADIATVIDETSSLATAQDITPMALANLAIDLVGADVPGHQLLNRILNSLKQ